MRGKNFHAGLFLVSAATLMYEMLLIRVFNVTMYYHYAFLAISIAMFGLTAGATAVYIFPRQFAGPNGGRRLVLSALAFSVALVAGFLFHISMPFRVKGSVLGVCYLIFTYSVLLIPFILSGICVCLALTARVKSFPKAYAANLTGSAAGCLLPLGLLTVADAPTSIFICGALAACGAFCFASARERGPIKNAAAAAGLIFALLAFANGSAAARHSPWVRLNWVKGRPAPQALYERWSPFSYIEVRERRADRPFGWGLSPVYHPKATPRELTMNMYPGGGSVLTFFDGDFSRVEHLRYDITNFAHHLRRNADVLVVGVGGGRDVLSALSFGQRSVTGVDIDKGVIDTLTGPFAGFTGHLDKMPNVKLVPAEARSYLSRNASKYDILQIPMVTAVNEMQAGSFVLRESPLFTVEAWRIFIQHLKPGEIISYSFWYYPDTPGNVHRVVLLADAALAGLGRAGPGEHIVVLKTLPPPVIKNKYLSSLATVLVSCDPFSAGDLETIKRTAERMKFDRVDHSGWTASAEKAVFHLFPPTDDKPFFFYLVDWRSVFERKARRSLAGMPEFKAVRDLIAACFIVIIGAAAVLVLPVFRRIERPAPGNLLAMSVFFISIGIGFMFIEIAQLQRFTLFLGHPAYGISAVIFTLLLSGGFGSYWTAHRGGQARLPPVFAALLFFLALFGFLAPQAIAVLGRTGMIYRVAAVLAMVFPTGFLMGMMYPLGMKSYAAHAGSLAPWFWSVNGAASACASLVAVVLMLEWGIAVLYGLGCGFYFLAFLAWAGQVRHADSR